jgi:serine/threonine-protein kinase
MTAVKIANRYELESRLGFGGMSTIHLALDTRLERHVVVKLLADHLASDATFVQRFRREAMAAARLVHPNIVQVFDSGLDAPTGQHYIVMEYIEGQSCAEIVRDQAPLALDEAVGIVAQACEGLDYAHRNGVVHRDVKPGNLLRSDDGVVKLADFGIAKAIEHTSITQAGSVLGTAAYLAPEQARGEEAGAPADLYGVGVVTYQLVSGRLPYEASSLTELALKQQHEDPIPLDELVPVPATFARAVERALAVEPAQRYATAREMATAFAAAAEGTEATAVVARRDPTDATRALPATPPRLPRQARRVHRPPAPAPVPVAREPARRRGRGLTLLFLALLAAAVAGGAVIATSDSPRGVQLRDVAYDSVDRAVEGLKELVEENTR